MTLGMVILGDKVLKRNASSHIAERFQVVHISTGDMLRSLCKREPSLGLRQNHYGFGRTRNR